MLLIAKHNPLAVCLRETFLKDTANITIREFNLYHTFQETILVNDNIPQCIVKLNTNLQAVAVKGTAHKTLSMFDLFTSLQSF